MIHAMIHICPECRSVVVYLPSAGDALFIDSAYICSDDGYRMKRIPLDDALADQLLKNEVPNANS